MSAAPSAKSNNQHDVLELPDYVDSNNKTENEDYSKQYDGECSEIKKYDAVEPSQVNADSTVRYRFESVNPFDGLTSLSAKPTSEQVTVEINIRGFE